MDTRNKILTASEALVTLQHRSRDSTLTVVTGYFDPLLACHARRLTEIAASRGRLTVVVADPEVPILPQRARAELVAALDAVEYVVLAEVSAEEFLTKVPMNSIMREDEADLRRTQDFVRNVLDRQMDKQMVPHG